MALTIPSALPLGTEIHPLSNMFSGVTCFPKQRAFPSNVLSENEMPWNEAPSGTLKLKHRTFIRKVPL
ncbi:hypothetical protein GGP80_003042 [Salinibacter ruber]|uniref:hypothetical protein n=1 Tax=Salinibacter ruber TaxID=146919 RepID=UPI0013C2CE44|nr:hypothetical protein [Salinibacter ruber]MCS3628915.1 hypothetical protein [Salinibacter ruber]MCS3685448.1 hypothetical protein [Salinibacter ruber]MCS3708325.1 hypothetical protein [Salinibacter ruber]MCS3937034.1 hypothetical protein [Salinibacter ruber]MCS4044712.1 hypothetical protein [Salinibacter ruber]